MALKIKRPEHGNLAALLGEEKERETPGVTVQQRRNAGGKRTVRSTDRRRKHGDARSRAYATNVTQAIHELVDKFTRQFDLTKAQFTENAILHYVEHLKQHGAGEDA